MDWNDFSLARTVYEVRYRPAYRLWDRAGAVAVGIDGILPDLKNKAAQPGQIVFASEKVAVSVELSLLRVITRRPTIAAKVEEHGALCATLERLVANVLELQQFDRVGARFIFGRPMKPGEDGAEAVIGTGLVAIPAAVRAHVAVGDRITQPEVAFRVENEAVGTAYRIRTETQTIEFEPGLDIDFVDIEGYSKSAHVIVYDVDRYTMTPLSLGKVDGAEWVKATYRTAVRDGERLLGGRP
jgi:hypothetical protein